MTRFIDGPAAGVVLTLRRAPRLLRVTGTPDGGFDALDMPEDILTEYESVWVYERVGNATQVHLKLARPKRSGWYMMAEYRQHPNPPSEPTLRDRENWLAWCLSQPEVKS